MSKKDKIKKAIKELKDKKIEGATVSEVDVPKFTDKQREALKKLQKQRKALGL